MDLKLVLSQKSSSHVNTLMISMQNAHTLNKIILASKCTLEIYEYIHK